MGWWLMDFTSEIFLTKKMITKDEWSNFIKVISHYNGCYRKWKLLITFDHNEIRFFVQTKFPLPATINSLGPFLFKETDKVTISPFKSTFSFFNGLCKNMIDLFNCCEIKGKGNLKYFEIDFRMFTK